ncbi:hypothetical protein DIPPA_08030 [Diplonema papillatum]|nr:hypothetical protein DIPPA_08030 [Diplonema papillatum]
MTAFSDRPSYEVKVHAVFEEFDTEKSRSISKDAFAAAMARYQLQLSAATVSDLHDRADKNNDGVVSYVEWQQFAEMYPTLLDCLYYRGKDHQSNMQQKEAVDRQKEFIQRLRKAERDGRLAITNAQAQSDDAERKLQQQGQAVADANSKQGLAKNALDAAKADTEAARVVLNKRNGDLGVANDNQRRAAAAAAEAKAAVDAAMRRLSEKQAAVSAAEDRMRDLERLMKEQQSELELQNAEAAKCHFDVDACDSRLKEAAGLCDDAQRTLSAATDASNDAQKALTERQQAEQEAAMAHRETVQNVAKQEGQRDIDTRNVAACKRNEEKKEAELDATLHAIASSERELSELEDEERSFTSKRMQINEEERPLIEQEIRLREQRACLETKEAKLVSDFVTFAGRAPRSVVSPREAAPSKATHPRHLPFPQPEDIVPATPVMVPTMHHSMPPSMPPPYVLSTPLVHPNPRELHHVQEAINRSREAKLVRDVQKARDATRDLQPAGYLAPELTTPHIPHHPATLPPATYLSAYSALSPRSRLVSPVTVAQTSPQAMPGFAYLG